MKQKKRDSISQTNESDIPYVVLVMDSLNIIYLICIIQRIIIRNKMNRKRQKGMKIYCEIESWNECW